MGGSENLTHFYPSFHSIEHPMKKIIILFLSSVALVAQSQVINNLVIFCNEGEKFTVILDGFKRNVSPQSNVRIEFLDQKHYKIKIIFENTRINDVDDGITFFKTGRECIFSLDKKNNHKYKLHYSSDKAMPGFEKPNNVNTANTTTNTSPPPIVDTVKPPPPEAPSGNPMDQNINQNLNIGGKKGAIKVNPNGTMSVGPGNGAMSINIKKHPKANCPNPVTKEEFAAFKENMSKQTTEEDKQLIGNSFIDNNCLLSSQVKEAMTLFKNERSQIDFAKKSYSATKDYEKFSITVDGVVSKSGKDELTKYIEDNK